MILGRPKRFLAALEGLWEAMDCSRRHCALGDLHLGQEQFLQAPQIVSRDHQPIEPVHALQAPPFLLNGFR